MKGLRGSDEMPECLNTRRGPESSSPSPLLIRCFFAGGSFRESSLTAWAFLIKGDRNGLLSMADAGQPLPPTMGEVKSAVRVVERVRPHVILGLTILKSERLRGLGTPSHVFESSL